jgi:uncharacterized phage protein gp47/JayE
MRIYDKQPSEIYLNAVEIAQMNIPQFELRVGTIEDSIFQAMAYMTALSVGHINALPNRLMEGVLAMMGLSRRNGSNATVTVDVELLTYNGTTIPAGTTFVHETSIFGEVITTYYQVDGTVTIDDVIQDPEEEPATPLPSGIVRIIAIDTGTVPTITVGDTLTILNLNTQVNSVTAQGDFLQGEEPEDDGEYLSRGVTFLSSLSEALVGANQIEKYIASTYSEVKRVRVYDLTDGELDDSVTAEPVPGYATAYVYGNSASLNIIQKVSIQRDVVDKSIAGLSVKVLGSRIVYPTVSASVTMENSLSITTASTSVATAIKDYLNPLYFPYTETSIRKNVLIGLLSKLPSVLYVSGMELSANEMALDEDSGNLIFSNKGDLPYLTDENLDIEFTVGGYT